MPDYYWRMDNYELFDTIKLKQENTEGWPYNLSYTFFNEPYGSEKSKSKTNMELPSILPRPKSFKPKFMVMTVFNPNRVSTVHLSNQGRLVFVIGCFCAVEIGPLGMFIHKYELPSNLIIPPEQNFGVNLELDSYHKSFDGLIVRLGLWGDLVSDLKYSKGDTNE